jgi:hypothetical protein
VRRVGVTVLAVLTLTATLAVLLAFLFHMGVATVTVTILVGLPALYLAWLRGYRHPHQFEVNPVCPAARHVHLPNVSRARRKLQGWPVPRYAAGYDIVRSIDLAMARARA